MANPARKERRGAQRTAVHVPRGWLAGSPRLDLIWRGPRMIRMPFQRPNPCVSRLPRKHRRCSNPCVAVRVQVTHARSSRVLFLSTVERLQSMPALPLCLYVCIACAWRRVCVAPQQTISGAPCAFFCSFRRPCFGVFLLSVCGRQSKAWLGRHHSKFPIKMPKDVCPAGKVEAFGALCVRSISPSSCFCTPLHAALC